MNARLNSSHILQLSCLLTMLLPTVAEAAEIVCGRGRTGIDCAVTNQTVNNLGTTFGAESTWQSTFSDANGWNSGPQYYSTIRLVDLNNDQLPDVCGRGSQGIDCALSNGSSFGGTSVWQPNFSDAAGWNSGPQYYSTIQFVDVDGDGFVDVCGRGRTGIDCAINNRIGTGFGGVSLRQADVSDANGWNSGPEYYSTIQYVDLNADGKLDVCARGRTGLLCALNNGSTFGSLSLWEADFSDAAGWNGGPQYYSTIRFADINGDGLPDVCARGRAGIDCGINLGGHFGSTTTWGPFWSDANGWTSGDAYPSIQLVDVDQDGFVDVCGRDSTGSPAVSTTEPAPFQSPIHCRSGKTRRSTS